MAEAHGSNEQKPDLSEIFDLNRHKAVKDFVDRFEDLTRQKDAIQQDIKEVAAEAAESMFSPVEIRSMQDMTKWRVKDKMNAAAEKIASLRRISNALKLDLFAWADKHRVE